MKMNSRKTGVLGYLLVGVMVFMTAASLYAASNIYDFTLPLLNGKAAPLASYKGKVVLVVNVASRCGFTPQYTALEATYGKYNVTFPVYGKVSVKGDDQTPLYSYLTKEANPAVAGDIKWNFTKFLVDRNGNVVQRFESAATPDSPDVIAAIEAQLKK